MANQAVRSAAIARYTKHLTQVYSKPLHGVQKLKYVDLSLTKKGSFSRDEAEEFLKLRLHGKIDEILEKKELVSLEDILKPDGQEDVRCVVVEGAPGVGKSVLAWELCRRWDKIEAMRKYSLVVYSDTESNSLPELLDHTDQLLAIAVAKEITENEGKNTLLILDCFSRFSESESPWLLIVGPQKKGSFIEQIIKGSQLPKATVLVMCRPSAIANICALSQIDKHVEIWGFSHQQIEQYARDMLNRTSISSIDFCLAVNTSMMCVPLFAAKILQFLGSCYAMPIMTQICESLTLAFLNKYLTFSVEKFDDLPHAYYEQFYSLARLAFEGLKKQEVLFDKLPDNCCCLGLMHTSTDLLYVGDGASVSYAFPSVALQEFLAAYHISSQRSDLQRGLFEQYADRSNVYMDGMWRFVAGLTGFESFGWDLVRSRRGVNEEGDVLPFLVQCLYEARISHGSVDARAVLRSLEGGVRFRGDRVGMTAYDCIALGYCVTASNCAWELKLGGNGLGAEVFEMLGIGLSLGGRVDVPIKELDLHDNPIKLDEVNVFEQNVEEAMRTITVLNLAGCGLNDADLDILDRIVPRFTNLEHLNISNNLAAVKPYHENLIRLLRTQEQALTEPITSSESGSSFEDQTSEAAAQETSEHESDNDDSIDAEVQNISEHESDNDDSIDAEVQKIYGGLGKRSPSQSEQDEGVPAVKKQPTRQQVSSPETSELPSSSQIDTTVTSSALATTSESVQGVMTSSGDVAQPMNAEEQLFVIGDLTVKNKCIGSGSFGGIHEGRLGVLPCAVKVLHGQNLFFPWQQEVRQEKLSRFKSECKFLEDLKHPHIVLHLATRIHPNSGIPLLVMELMDESLTKFLGRSSEPLSLHTQKRLCYDVALALAFLHSKNIVHRDLSSNNVLLLGTRAKVADFGISRLIEGDKFEKTLTSTMPGSKNYMPPEAWFSGIKYDGKFDIFSFGVLIVQIITRLPPVTGDRAVPDESVPGGYRHLLEVERREHHIRMIEGHQLYDLAIACLKDKCKDRPPASDICRKLDALFIDTPRD